MITKMPTDAELKKWKSLFDEYGAKLTPNRKSGREIDEYLNGKYDCKPLNSKKFASVVEWNILNNPPLKIKLNGEKPDVKSYTVNGALVGIDLVSGEFFVECEDADKAALIYDDLFVFRGLDEDDLKNFVLVGEYLLLKN